MTKLSVIPPASQQRWHEIYKAAPLVIILLYLRTVGDRPVTQSEIAENFKISRNTAAQKLRILSQMGAIYKVDHNTGYALSDGGRQMLLSLDEPGCSKSEHPSLKESFFLNLKDSNDSKDMKERKKQMLKILKDLTKDQILSETGKLFPGHEVICFGLSDKLESDYIIAWLAQAYDQHRQGRISHPWALVYRRLQTNRNLPDKKYQADPFQFLPAEFLSVLGFAPYIADPDPIEEDIVRVIEYASTVEQEIYEAWMQVQDILRQDMPRAAFDTWVQDTYPDSYENGLLRVAVRNPYAADWLTSRVKSTVQRLLIGLLDESNVRVEFIVPAYDD